MKIMFQHTEKKKEIISPTKVLHHSSVITTSLSIASQCLFELDNCNLTLFMYNLPYLFLSKIFIHISMNHPSHELDRIGTGSR